MTARIGAFGACTAIGRTALETAMAHRARLGPLRVQKRVGLPRVALALGGDEAPAAGDEATPGGISAALRAWREAAAHATANGLGSIAASAPVVIAIPDDVELHVGGRTVARWAGAFGLTVPRDATTVVRGGATASARAIEAALGALAAGAAAVWVVGAAVPGRGPPASAGRRAGEAGAALLLLGAAAPAPARPIGRLLTATVAPRDDGGGLLALAARAGAGAEALWLVGELSGHHDAVRETQGLGAASRSGRVDEMAVACGELGAAAGLVAVATACARAAAASAPANRVACLLQSEARATELVALTGPARPAEHAVIAIELAPADAGGDEPAVAASADAEGAERAAWAAIERALELYTVPEPAVREAEAAWDVLASVDDSGASRATALADALAQTRRAIEAQMKYGADGVFTRRMRAAERALLDAIAEPERAAPPETDGPCSFRASFGVPSSHAVEPAPMRLGDATGRSGKMIDEDAVLLDDGDDAPEPTAPPAGAEVVPAALAHLPLAIRRLVLTLGRLGVLRVPYGDAPFTWSLAAFDQRLLEHVDALAALGARGQGPPGVEATPLARLVLVAGLPIYDPIAAFGRAFALGCFAGERHARAAVFALKASLPLVRPACSAALALGSSSDLRAVLEELARDGDPALAALALDVLRARGDASVGVAVPLLSHPQREVQRAAVLLVAAARDASPDLLERLLAEHPEDIVGAATALPLAVTGSPAGIHHARLLLDEERRSPRFLSAATAVELLRALALAGDEEDLARVGALAIRLDAIELVGWFGHLGGVTPLLAELEAAPPGHITRRERAGSALERLLGPLELGALQPGEPPDVRPWRAAWAERGPRLDPRKRHRRGRLHAASEVLAELERDGVRPADRALAALEIAVLTRTPWWPWTETWIARQRRVIRDLGARVRDLGTSPLHAPGRWPLATLGRARAR